MPVLRREGVPEAVAQQMIDDRQHLVATGDRELATGHEGGLHIDDAEDIGAQIQFQPGHGSDVLDWQ